VAERQLPKLNVAGSIPVSRSNIINICVIQLQPAQPTPARLDHSISPAFSWSGVHRKPATGPQRDEWL